MHLCHRYLILYSKNRQIIDPIPQTPVPVCVCMCVCCVCVLCVCVRGSTKRETTVTVSLSRPSLPVRVPGKKLTDRRQWPAVTQHEVLILGHHVSTEVSAKVSMRLVPSYD